MAGEFEDSDRFSTTRSPLDDELIEHYCGDIEERIRSAANGAEARRIAGDACRELDNLCVSDIIPNFLSRHVHNLLQKYWGDPT